MQALDNNQELSEEQRRVHEEIQHLQNEDTLCGMFDEPEEDAAAAPDNNFPEV